jgi:hypothetical protein
MRVIGGRDGKEEPDPEDLRRLLRRGGQRRREEGEGEESDDSTHVP